jgi:hypothetical protein
MKLRPIHIALFISFLASGCELVADFDRGKIPSDRPDTGVTLPPDDDDEDDEDEEDGGALDGSTPRDASD